MTTLGTSNPISRRAFLPLIATATLSPVLLTPFTAIAQGSNWQIYSRDDLGFEVEMPGKPVLRESRTDGMTVIDAEVDVDQMTFGAGFTEFNGGGASIEQVADAQRMAARHLGIEATRVTSVTMNGFPGLDIVSESDGLSMVLRIILKQNQSIVAGVTGHGALSRHPAARRFLDSLKLLP